MPLRSIDLRTKEPQQASVERSDTCVVPAAGVVGEAMVAWCWPTPLLEKFGGDSLTELLDHLEATRARWREFLAAPTLTRARTSAIHRAPWPIRPIVKYGDPVLHAPSAARGGDRRRHPRRSFDDMVETMYAAPGIGLAAPQIAVPLRVIVIDLSVGEDPKQLIKLVNPEFVEKEGEQRARGGLPLRPGLRRLARAARARGGEGPRPRRQGARLRRAPSCWPAPSATRSTTSTACSSWTGSRR